MSTTCAVLLTSGSLHFSLLAVLSSSSVVFKNHLFNPLQGLTLKSQNPIFSFEAIRFKASTVYKSIINLTFDFLAE